jgi:hypothetical protein
MLDWKDVDPKGILVERMTGLTNETYKVSVPNSTYTPLIFRKFGDATESKFVLSRDVFLER